MTKSLNMMEQTMRWYGPEDPVSLSDIRQAGASGIVTALHHLPNGMVWSREAIRERKQHIEAAGLRWSVVESVPVHEAIKTRSGAFESYIENYQTTLRNLAAEGIFTVCYNFMPILDWIRTDLEYRLPNGAKTLYFNKRALAAFDCFILKRPGAKEDYPDGLLEQASQYYESLDIFALEQLKRNLLDNLPGAEIGYTLEEFQQALNGYQNIDHNTLCEHLRLFLEAVIPVAEEAGVYMAIHPDDPPFPVLGLPRIMSTASDVARILKDNSSVHNGITFCTGSFGVRADNDLPQMVRDYGDHIHFVHLRSTQCDAAGNFFEANHLEGDVPMFEVVKELLRVQAKREVVLPMRPDHGHQLMDDLGKKTNPGYTAIGRLKGLAELRGLMYALCQAGLY